MNKRICCIDKCQNASLARGLCKFHYNKAWREGTLDFWGTDEDRSTWHQLSDLDPDQKTATCSKCGPVAIRFRSGGRGAECLTKRNGGRRHGPEPRSYWANNSRVRSRLKSKYGMTLEEYDDMSIEQGGRCAICNQTGAKLFVDHDHTTGNVRGLLCHLCNCGIGFFREDTSSMHSAIRYLAG